MAKGLSPTSNKRIKAIRNRRSYLKRKLRVILERYREEPSAHNLEEIYTTTNNLALLGCETDFPAWFKLIIEFDRQSFAEYLRRV